MFRALKQWNTIKNFKDLNLILTFRSKKLKLLLEKNKNVAKIMFEVLFFTKSIIIKSFNIVLFFAPYNVSPDR